LSTGLVARRRCTDCFCIIVFIVAQVGFVVVTIAGLRDGNPSRLYFPRDYRGAYCGIAENWNGGPNTERHPHLSYTMNVTASVDSAAKQMICSSVARQALVTGADGEEPLLKDEADRAKYLCDCCLVPCGRCDRAFASGGDLSTPHDLVSTITARMAELTDPDLASSLFSDHGANAETFGNSVFWGQATRYLNQVCLPECSMSVAEGENGTESDFRSYTYRPAQDERLHFAWMALLEAPESSSLAAPIRSVMLSAFTFKALSRNDCPYDSSLCIPMPGIAFTNIAPGSGYCSFSLAADVANSVGEAAAGAFESLGGASLKASVTETFGEWVGDFQQTEDSFVVVSVLSFVIGLAFIVALRFFIGFCVWGAVVVTVLMFFIAGAGTYVRSGQCAGVGFIESSQQAMHAVKSAARARANRFRGGEVSNETMAELGDGSDYRGTQRFTKSGLPCLDWATQTRMPQYTPENYNESGLVKNYCRNPYDEDDDLYKARTIWCITGDPEVLWEECLPVGLLQPVCLRGYAVTEPGWRDALKASAFVIWFLGIVWMISVCCLANRIRLAIALNKVAAEFVAMNPRVLLIPIMQTLAAILWTVAWLYAASFLLSQVPAKYTPMGYYATYEEAYGTPSTCGPFERNAECQGTPGACTDKWPMGFVWKDTACETGPDGEPLCWRCAPPRYAVDPRMAASFFVFLWNSSFNVAMGQCLIAFATGAWFFGRTRSPHVVRQAVHTMFRYHLGSIALGSFIVALVQFIKYILEFLQRQAAARKNRCLVVVFRVLQCCVWVFEKFVKYISKNAYIQMALLGKPFCASAKAAYFLITRNLFRFGAMAALGAMIRLIGYLFIVAGTMIIGFLIVRAMHEEVSPFVPLVCFAIVSCVVARLFMTVFGLAVDTSLHCFLAVEEMGVGREHVPKVLRAFVMSRSDKEKLQYEVDAGASSPAHASPARRAGHAAISPTRAGGVGSFYDSQASNIDDRDGHASPMQI